MSEWIEKEQENISQDKRISKRKHKNVKDIPPYKLRGVVLAPNNNNKSEQFGAVAVVCGEDAIKLLGGLRQIARWLE